MFSQNTNDLIPLSSFQENGMNMLNFQPGFESSVYDTKNGGDFHLEDALPGRLIRNRFPFNGNMITMTHRQGREGVFNVSTMSVLLHL